MESFCYTIISEVDSYNRIHYFFKDLLSNYILLLDTDGKSFVWDLFGIVRKEKKET